MYAFVGIICGLSILAGGSLGLLTLIAMFRRKPDQAKRFRNFMFADIGLFVLCVIIGTVIQPEKDRKAFEAQQTAKEASQQAAAASSSSLAAAGDAARDKTLGEQFKAEMIAAFKPCDDASQAALTANNNNASVYELYDLFRAGKDACYQSYSALNRMDVPNFNDHDLRKIYRDAKDLCRDAMSSKSFVLDKLADIANGNQKPSDVSDAKERLREADAGITRCVMTYLVAANKSGVEIKPGDFGEDARRNDR